MTKRASRKTKEGIAARDSYVLRNGKMYHNYPVYSDGRINMQWHVGSFRYLQDEADALEKIQKTFYHFIHERNLSLQTRIREFWTSFFSELALIDPTFDKTRFVYGLDPDTGFLTKSDTPETQPDLTTAQEPREP